MRKSMTYKLFSRLHDALKSAIEQGATRVGFNGSSFSFERQAKTVEGAPATCILFLNGDRRWQLEEWYVGTGGDIELQPEPEKALARAIAQAYLSQPNKDNVPIPRTIQTEDRWQFHLSENGYQSADGGNWDVDGIMKYLSLSQEEQEDSLVPDFDVKSWVGDSAGIDWSKYLYSPNQVKMRLRFCSADRSAHYVGVISWEGEIVIEDSLGATTWSRGDRLSVEEVNEFPEIRAESWAYGAACELGIKVTHREESADCGTYCPVSD
jgi:hypothetical protein